MFKTYINIYKKYLPAILFILIIMMLAGMGIRKKIYNKDYSKIKEKVIVIDKDNSNLSRLAKKVIAKSNNIIELKNEEGVYSSLQNGRVKAVFIIQKDLQKEFFESAEKDSKVLKKVIEHYGLSREKTAGFSVGELFQFFNLDIIDLNEYKEKYSKDEKGQKEFLDNIEKKIHEIQNVEDSLNLEFIDFNKNKIKFNRNILDIVFNLLALIILVVLSSKARLDLFKYSEFKNEKIVLKNILHADILFFLVYTVFTIMVSWLSNMNALNALEMVYLFGIHLFIAASTYLLTFVFMKTNKKSKDK